MKSKQFSHRELTRNPHLYGEPIEVDLLSTLGSRTMANWFKTLSDQKRGSVLEDIISGHLNGHSLFEHASADGSYKEEWIPHYMKLGHKYGRIYEIKTSSMHNKQPCGFSQRNCAILAKYLGDFVCGFYDLNVMILHYWVFDVKSGLLGRYNEFLSLADDPKIYWEHKMYDANVVHPTLVNPNPFKRARYG